MAWLEDGAGRHGGVVEEDGAAVVVDGLDVVRAGECDEGECSRGGIAGQEAAEEGGAAPIVNREGVGDGDRAAGGAARGVGPKDRWEDCGGEEEEEEGGGGAHSRYGFCLLWHLKEHRGKLFLFRLNFCVY